MTETLMHGKCPTCGITHTKDDQCELPKHEPNKAPIRRDPVVEAVRADLHRRSQLGMAKYGKTLAENPLTETQWLQHAYEEALDLANYLKTLIMKREADDRAKFTEGL